MTPIGAEVCQGQSYPSGSETKNDSLVEVTSGLQIARDGRHLGHCDEERYQGRSLAGFWEA